MDWKKVANKWQKKWEKDKIFEAEVNDKPKFFGNAPYPYVNAYPHIGHLFTYMRTETFTRYKRLKGFNVMYPQAWHATGSPIVQAAKRTREEEPKQIKLMRDMKLKDFKKFEDPKHWIDFFVPEFEKDFRSMGLNIDWRRSFYTTDLNPHYDKFIRWQFRKLKEKGYVIKGKFPVVWDPKEGLPVGDHDRVEGEGETPQEFVLVKHKLEENRFIITATLRPDTILGMTNLFISPHVKYSEIQIDGEQWILGKSAVQKLQDQDRELKITGSIKGDELIGKRTEEIDGDKILILPATFIDEEFGTGIVHSCITDSPDDLIALRDAQKDEKTLKKYNIDPEEVKEIKPKPVLITGELGDFPAEKLIEKYNVKSQNEKEKMEKMKKELYKLSFNISVFNSKYKDFFSRNYEGVKVSEGKDHVKTEVIEMGWADTFYQLTGKVVSRSLTECVVKIVDDQWFLNYEDEKWKKLAHKCLDKMKLYPEKARTQFDYVIDWLHEWACTREEGLGTRLPWDEKWLIESLSDSTIYLAFYTFTHILKEIPIDQVDDNLFDYIMLGKNSELKCDKELAKQMRKEFDYWYPFDFRNSGKDLIQNHLTFLIFNHVAIFPEDKWPKSFGTNGWVTVDGQKMSKSLGNMISIREMATRFGPDTSRITILSGGESLDDPNWDTNFAESMNQKFTQIYTFFTESYGKGRDERKDIDSWAKSKYNRIVKEATEAMEETLFRTAIQKIFFDLNKLARAYHKKSGENPNKDLMKQIIEAVVLMLNPFTPHLSEEIWEKIGGKGYSSLAEWPAFNEKLIDEEAEAAEELIDQVRADLIQVLELARIKQPKKITLFVAPQWKNDFIKKIKEQMKETRNPGDIIKAVMSTDLKKYGKEITKTIPMLVNNPGKLPELVLGTKNEHKKLNSQKETLEKEFKCSFEVIYSEDSKDPKASKAMPAKPAIVVE